MGAMNHDALSKALFTLPPVEADLLRIVAAGWVHLLDLGGLERLGAEHPSADQSQRIGDIAWRARFRDGELLDGNRPWLLSPTECQSTRDPEMGERLAEYLGRHLRALRLAGTLRREGEGPRVLPVVVYDGERRWRRVADPSGVPVLLQPEGYAVLDAGAGALEDWPSVNRVTCWVRLLRAHDLDELLVRLVEGLREFPEASDEGFREAFYAWAQALWELKAPGAGALPPRAELENSQGEQEMTTLLEANIDKWKAGLIQQGMERGIAQGRTEARAQLGRQVGRKFGDRAAERLAVLIEGESDPERLAEVGDWIIDCATEAEFLARAQRRS